MKFLSEDQVKQQLDVGKVVDALRVAFAGLASGDTVQPAQTITVFPNDEGDCIYYPGVLWGKHLLGAKLSPFLMPRKRAGKKPVSAYTLLISAETGEPILLCDSLYLTTIRTAATTALAEEYLRPDGAKTLAVIGFGPLALAHLEIVGSRHPWQTITVFSPSLVTGDANKTAAFAKAKAKFPKLNTAKTAQEAVKDADVVLLCTSSGKPVIETRWLKLGCLVTSISTNVPRAHEINPSDLTQFDVYCDYRKTAPSTAGEMIIAKESHGWNPDAIVADIPELTAGQKTMGNSRNGRVRFFRSTGLGLEDLAIASLLI